MTHAHDLRRYIDAVATLALVEASYQEIIESFDRPEPFQWEPASSNEMLGRFAVDAVEYRLAISKDMRMPSAWSCVFGVPAGVLTYLLMPKRKQFKSTHANHPFRVFATVIAGLQDFLTTKHPACLYFMAKDRARQQLYSMLLRRMATKLQGLGYRAQQTVQTKRGLIFLIAGTQDDIETFLEIAELA